MEEKKRMMDHFMALQTEDYGPFIEQLQLFKLDLGLPEHTSPQEVLPQSASFQVLTQKERLQNCHGGFHGIKVVKNRSLNSEC